MEFGPVQILVVGFEHGKFEGKALAELRRLREHDIVRLLDLLFVRKDEDGNIEEIELSDIPREEAVELGAPAGALMGFGAEGEEGAKPAPGRRRGRRGGLLARRGESLVPRGCDPAWIRCLHRPTRASLGHPPA